MDYFALQICLGWLGKSIFWKFSEFEPFPLENQVNYYHDKCSYRNDIETRKYPKNKEKIELKFAI